MHGPLALVDLPLEVCCHEDDEEEDEYGNGGDHHGRQIHCEGAQGKVMSCGGLTSWSGGAFLILLLLIQLSEKGPTEVTGFAM